MGQTLKRDCTEFLQNKQRPKIQPLLFFFLQRISNTKSVVCAYKLYWGPGQSDWTFTSALLWAGSWTTWILRSESKNHELLG